MKMRVDNVLKGEDCTVNESFMRFDLYNRSKNLSNRTIDYYFLEYNRFISFLKFRFNNTTTEHITDVVYISQIDRAMVMQYIVYLQDKTHANDVTIASYMRAIRAWLYFCMKDGMLPHFEITIPKAEEKIKKTYTDSELIKLLKKPNLKKCSFAEYRTWVLENYLIATGNRLNTVRNLHISDLDFENNLIYMTTTKNRKQQIIPMADSLKPILQQYIQLLHHNGLTDDGYVFCNEQGKQSAQHTLESAVRRYNHNRGVNATSMHEFRHTYAKMFITNGGGTFQLQKLLGHYDLTMTRKYVNMFSTDLQKDYNRVNPLDVLNQNNNKNMRIK